MAKILVAVKRCIDYSVKIRVKPEKDNVVTEGIKFSMNPFDEIAIEEAVVLKEKNFAKEVIAITCGPQASQDTLRVALAMGATSATHIFIPDTDYTLIQPIHISKILTKLAQDEKADLILLGKQAIDDDSNQTAQMTASYLDWPQVTFCSKVETEGKSLTATREIDGGLEKIKVNLPAVLSTDLRLNTPRYATLPNIMKAKKMALKVIKASDLGLDLNPRIQILSVDTPPQRSAGIMVNSVEELLTNLRKINLIK